MYDIHSHLLWGIDDGVQTVGEAQEICRISASQGVKHICATPHFIIDEIQQERHVLEDKIDLLNDWCAAIGLDLKISIGCETYINPFLPNLIEEKKIFTINDSKYILIEFPMNELPIYTEETLYKIQLKGFIPIIAHPERYSFFRNDPNKLYNLVERGNLIQCNAGSFLGYFGKSAKEFVYLLLEHRMVHVIGSDSHTTATTGRGPCMKSAFEAIDKAYPNYYTDRLTDNSKKIIENKEISFEEPIKFKIESKRKLKRRSKVENKENGFWSELIKLLT